MAKKKMSKAQRKAVNQAINQAVSAVPETESKAEGTTPSAETKSKGTGKVKAPVPKPPAEFDYKPGAKAWFQRNKIYFFAFLIPVLIFYVAYALFGLYPFGEESVLALDLNGQYIYYFEAFRDAIWGDNSIFYSWSRSLSGEFMGVIGYYLASPFTLITVLLPRTMILGAMEIMILTKLGAAAVTFNYFIHKSKHVTGLPSLILSTCYGLMAYGVIQTIDPMWLDGLVFLPMIALGVEYLVDDGRKLNLIIPLAWMVVAHFYIGYMICIFTAFYFLYYLFAGSEKMRYTFSNVMITCFRMLAATITALMISCILLLPVVHSLQLGKFEFSEPDWSFRTNFPPLQFFAQMLVAQYDSVNVQGSPEIYCGIIALVLLPMFYLNDEVKLRKKIGLTALLAIMFTCMYIHPIDMALHGGQDPNWLPYRYSFTVSFVLLSIGAQAMEKIQKLTPKQLGAGFFSVFIIAMFIETQKLEHIDTFKSLWLSVGLAGLYSVLLLGFIKMKNKNVMPLLMLLAISGELCYNSVDSLKKIDKEVAYSKRSSYNEYIKAGRENIQRLYEYDDTIYRTEKTYHRTVNDSLAFGNFGITHSSSVMNTKVLKFIEAMGYSCRSYYSRYNGYTPLSDSILGIKYVLDRDGYVIDTYELQYEDTMITQSENEETVKIYKNPNALSLGYMVSDDIEKIAFFGNDNPFNSQNILLSTLLGKTKFEGANGGISAFTSYYKRIAVTPSEFITQNVTVSDYGSQVCYNAQDTGDSTVDIRLQATCDEPIYFFLKTENEKSVNLWLADQWVDDPATLSNVDGSNAEWVSSYFETDNYRIVNLGRFEAGQELTLRISVVNDYTIIGDFQFYHFDEDLFQQDIDKLKANQWNLNLEKTGGTNLEGTIIAEEGQIMMTTIPSEPGWTVWVDGKKVEPVELFEAFIGIPLEPGTHTVRMHFIPNGFILGCILFVLGSLISVCFYLYDRKHNKVLVAFYKYKAQQKA